MLRCGAIRGIVCLVGLAVALAVSGASAFPHQKPEDRQQIGTEVQALRGGEAVEMNAPPPTVVNFGCKCDAAGAIYLAYSDSPPVLTQGSGLSGVPVSKISLRSRQVVRYAVPTRIRDFEGHVSRLSFDVSADGTLYALFNTGRREADGTMKPEFLIGRYKEDGGIDSYVPVGQIRGTQAQPFRMAVLFNGTAFLLSGTSVLEKDLGSFSGLFTGSGEFVKPLTLTKPGAGRPQNNGTETTAQSATALSHAKQLEAEADNPVSLESSALSFSADDGNVYLLKGTSEATLYVLSPLGEVLRQYELHPPAADLSPLQMAQSGAGYLFIYYGHVSTGEPDEPKSHSGDVITVLNAATGQVTATYRMPQEQRLRLPACAESPRKFTFLGASADNRRLTVTPYSAP